MEKLSADELKWRAKDDARCLAQAEMIKEDKERYNLALEGAREIAKEEFKRIRGIAKVANVKTPKNTTPPQNSLPSNSNQFNNPTNAQEVFSRRTHTNKATISRL